MDSPVAADEGQSSPLFTLPQELLLTVCEYLPVVHHSAFSRTCWCLTRTLQEGVFKKASPIHKARTYEAMYYGCTKSNCHVIRRSLLYGCPPDIDQELFDGQTALSLASRQRNPDTVTYLIQQHANVNEEGPDGLTALSSALEGLQRTRSGQPYYHIVLELLKAGASANCTLRDHLTGFHPLGNAVTVVTAAWFCGALVPKQALRLIKELVHKGVSPNARDDHGSPINTAVRLHKKTPEFLEFLLQQGADPDYGIELPLYSGRAALKTAIDEGDIPAMQTLLRHGAHPGPGPDGTETPLLVAVRCQNFDAVVTLLEQGISPNVVETAEDYRRRNSSAPFAPTALIAAVVTIVEQLIRAGADVNLCILPDDTVSSVWNEGARSPLEVALLESNLGSRWGHGEISDYFNLEKIYSDDGITVQEIPPSYAWADPIIPHLLRAGAKVYPKMIANLGITLKRWYPDDFRHYEAENERRSRSEEKSLADTSSIGRGFVTGFEAQGDEDW
ncbi:ankyrin repeat-containing domain protein [Coniochaeta sp. 2T2.1]|nr:ankyrin repeat-containing domain protein [Coniochaeta sp. 2T2.1]